MARAIGQQPGDADEGFVDPRTAHADAVAADQARRQADRDAWSRVLRMRREAEREVRELRWEWESLLVRWAKGDDVEAAVLEVETELDDAQRIARRWQAAAERMAPSTPRDPGTGAPL
jgi:hypothetical protein